VLIWGSRPWAAAVTQKKLLSADCVLRISFTSRVPRLFIYFLLSLIDTIVEWEDSLPYGVGLVPSSILIFCFFLELVLSTARRVLFGCWTAHNTNPNIRNLTRVLYFPVQTQWLSFQQSTWPVQATSFSMFNGDSTSSRLPRWSPVALSCSWRPSLSPRYVWFQDLKKWTWREIVLLFRCDKPCHHSHCWLVPDRLWVFSFPEFFHSQLASP